MTQGAALLELQRLDLEILRGKKRLDELPEKRTILELRHKQREVGTLHHKAELLLTKLRSDLKAHQDEIEMITAKLDAEQAKIMETTDHRAVATLTREMDSLRRRRDKMEMESLQLMERIDKASAQMATIDAALAQLAEKDTAAVETFKAVGGALQNDIASFETQRTKVAASIDADTLARYDVLRESKGGVGVGHLEGDSCSACRMSLPAERLGQLQAGPEVSICPQCRRLIVVRVEDE